MTQGVASPAREGVGGRIAVGVSGTGSNLRALHEAATRGALGGEIVLAFADRACPALDWAAEQGLETALVPGGEDARLAETLRAVAPDIVVLAGYMRIVGPATLAAFEGRILNTHPSLLPAFPGAHAVRDALAHGARVTGCTVHLVDATLDGGPILAQEAVPMLPGDDEARLHERIKAVEHRLLPARVARVLAERLGTAPPRPRRALLAVSDKSGLVEFARALVGLGFELVSTGGTAAALRAAELPVTDVAAVTGFPEMLDGRVKTLHPRVHAGILADQHSEAHRESLGAAGIAPFELVAVNLYPFAGAVERDGAVLADVVEQIDIGGPALIRAAAKNHGSVAVVTSPDQYPAVVEALRAGGEVPIELRSGLAIEAFRLTAAYDGRIAAELPCFVDADGVSLPPWPGMPRSGDPFPSTLTIALEKVDTLRYGENPHQLAARYRRPGRGAERGLFATGDPPLQGKALSYNNVLDAAAAAAVGRSLHGPACVIVKHTNPCGAAERGTLLEAWAAALAGDPVSAFGGVVAVTRLVDRELAERLSALFLELVVAPAFEGAALETLASKPNLRLLIDPELASDDAPPLPSNTASIRTAGGAVLVSSPDSMADDPSAWVCVTSRGPTESERRDLDLAWRLVRGLSSNAIALVRDGALIGMGSGQVSRVEAARQAVEKARRFAGEDMLRGAACGSDAFFPFPDAVEACLEAGVTAFVQPGGSVNDAKTTLAVDAVDGTMLITARRHFRH
ncbi:MAG: bifunctional phosphoribosylaminoimidazolecarboxamide formyltransferase/IMP cyclohydrolase [Chloroflexi bacterium]|nr:bifunctional phosphoribosylaminoimidazolecarboxamide formyltransferase/IMP cyclohydrolase [Chloroflexota bacterium]